MMGVEDMPQMKSLSPGLPLSPPKNKVQQVSKVAQTELFSVLRQRCHYQMICHEFVWDKVVPKRLLWDKLMSEFDGKNSERNVLYIWIKIAYWKIRTVNKISSCSHNAIRLQGTCVAGDVHSVAQLLSHMKR